MEEKKTYLFRVTHPAHGEVEVEATDRYSAVLAAARDWGLRWTTIGRECFVTELCEIPKKKKEVPQNGKTHKKKHRNH